MFRIDGNAQLTLFQLRVLAHVASGLTLREAAQMEYVSSSHAYNEIQRVKTELGARTIASCVMRAHAMGFLHAATGPEFSVAIRDRRHPVL